MSNNVYYKKIQHIFNNTHYPKPAFVGRLHTVQKPAQLLDSIILRIYLKDSKQYLNKSQQPSRKELISINNYIGI